MKEGHLRTGFVGSRRPGHAVGYLLLAAMFLLAWSATIVQAGEAKVYGGSTGYKVVARVDGNKVYRGSSGYTIAGRIDGNKVYLGSTGYKVILRGDGAGRRQLLAVATLR